MASNRGYSPPLYQRMLCRFFGVHEWSYVGEQIEKLRFGYAGYNRVCRACGKRRWWV